MYNWEATSTNFIVFGFTRPGLESTIYRTRGELANHYATDAMKGVVIPSQERLCNVHGSYISDKTYQELLVFTWAEIIFKIGICNHLKHLA